MAVSTSWRPKRNCWSRHPRPSKRRWSSECRVWHGTKTRGRRAGLGHRVKGHGRGRSGQGRAYPHGSVPWHRRRLGCGRCCSQAKGLIDWVDCLRGVSSRANQIRPRQDARAATWGVPIPGCWGPRSIRDVCGADRDPLSPRHPYRMRVCLGGRGGGGGSEKGLWDQGTPPEKMRGVVVEARAGRGLSSAYRASLRCRSLQTGVEGAVAQGCVWCEKAVVEWSFT